MSSDYLIVHKKMLPDYFEKVIEARNLLESKEVDTVTEAVKRVDISRNTYYKYKDFVFPYDSKQNVRRAVMSFIIKDEEGSLSSIIYKLSQYSISILTISQAVPVAGKANVLLSLDISKLSANIHEVMEQLEQMPIVTYAHLDAME